MEGPGKNFLEKMKVTFEKKLMRNHELERESTLY